MKLKLTSLILALVLCISCLSGCGAKSPAAPAETPVPAAETPTPAEETAAPEETAPAESDEGTDESLALYEKYLHAYEKYDSDTVVMTVNGRDIPWHEFFSWLYDVTAQLEINYGVTDWNEPIPQLEGLLDDPCYGDYAFFIAATNSKQISVINSKAAELGISLSEDQKAELELTMQSYRDYYGGEEEFQNILSESFLEEDYFRLQNETMMEYDSIYEYMYGANGEKLAADEAVAYARDLGYMYAKHILFSTVDDERNPLPDETVAEKKALAETVLAELQACSADILEETFDKLAAEYSEDPGLISNPDGYYFLPGEMVSEFESAAAALNENELSGIVESAYGYHILFCPVLEADAVLGYNSQYTPYTVRDIAATSQFSDLAQSWFDDAVVVTAEAFADFDMNALLAP